MTDQLRVDQLRVDLAALAKLFEPDGTWAQHGFAFDRNGDLAATNSPNACRWCLTGGTRKVTPDLMRDFTLRKHLAANIDTPRPIHRPRASVSYWNDRPERTQQDIRDLIAKAQKALDHAIL